MIRRLVVGRGLGYLFAVLHRAIVVAALLFTACHHDAAPATPATPTGSGGGSAGSAAPVELGIGVAAPFATPGERMSYRLLARRRRDPRGFDLGVGDVQRRSRGKKAIEIQGHARALGVVVVGHPRSDDKLTSAWIDVATSSAGAVRRRRKGDEGRLDRAHL